MNMKLFTFTNFCREFKKGKDPYSSPDRTYFFWKKWSKEYVEYCRGHELEWEDVGYDMTGVSFDNLQFAQSMGRRGADIANKKITKSKRIEAAHKAWRTKRLTHR